MADRAQDDRIYKERGKICLGQAFFLYVKDSYIHADYIIMPTSAKLVTSAQLAMKLATKRFFNCALP